MLPFVFAAYIGARRPLVVAGREPVPIVHCDTEPARVVTRRLAQTIQLASPAPRRRTDAATTELGVVTELAFPGGEPNTRTVQAAWSGFACALFAETS